MCNKCVIAAKEYDDACNLAITIYELEMTPKWQKFLRKQKEARRRYEKVIVKCRTETILKGVLK